MLTLALGVAATTAIFSVVNAALLRPLPYRDAGALVDIRTRLVDGRVTSGLVSGLEMAALASQTSLVQAVAGYVSQPFDVSWLRDDGAASSLVACGVTRGFFELLGVPVVAGRTFTPDEHLPAGRDAPMSVILSEAAWTRLFGRDPTVVGRAVRIAEFRVTTTIVGVASAVVDLPHGVDFYFNARSTARDTSHSFAGIVRLAPGATLEQLRSAGNAAMLALAESESTTVGREYVMRPLVSAIVGDLAPVLLIALGTTALLMALACVNVTNLLLARGVARTQEMALRSALGATPGGIIRQLLIESTVLATAGALLGFALAAAGVRGLLAFSAVALPRLESVPLDGAVLLFGIIIVITTGLVVGLAPAWRLARIDIRTLLNEHTRSATAGVSTSRTMSVLVVAETALALAIVAGAGWLVQSFDRLRRIDPGFVADHRLVIDVRPTKLFADRELAATWARSLHDNVRNVPGVTLLGSGSTFPLRDTVSGTQSVEVGHEPADAARVRGAVVRFAFPGYFEAMGIPLVTGRTLTDDDRSTSRPVALVNRAFASRFFAGRDPLSGTFAYGFPTVDRRNMIQVVGVVEDVRFKMLSEPDEAAFYLPAAQVPFPAVRFAMIAHAPGSDLRALIGPIREALSRADPALVVKFTEASAVIDAASARQQLGMTMMLIFATTALALAAIGIYGVIAYAAEQRQPELATRMALGAQRPQIFSLMMLGGQRLAWAGLAAGLIVAYAAGRLVSSSVYGMTADDPLVLLMATAAVGVVTVLATAVPAIRASRLDPARAWRPPSPR